MTNQTTRLVNLIEFAEQCARMRTSPPVDVGRHPFVLHEFQVQGRTGIHVGLPPGPDGDEVWLRVDRLHETKAPNVKSALLIPWIEMTQSADLEPKLKSSVAGSALIEAGTHRSALVAAQPGSLLETVQPGERIQFNSYGKKQDVEKEFQNYLTECWNPWATEERNRRSTIKLYSQLFTLKQEVEGGLVDAPIELAWAAGMMLWKYASGNLSYPLLSTLVELSLNPETAAMEVRPRDSVPRVESDWFTANDVAGIAEVERAAKEFFAKPDMYFCPLDHGTFEPLLRTAVTHLDSAGAYVPDSATPGDRSIPKPEVNLKVTDTWVLFARPRTNSEFIRDLERFKAKVESQTTFDSVPGAVRAVITEPTNESAEVPLPSFRGVASTYSGGAESTTEAQHLYFPKSFNDEQVRIVQLLDSCDGVVVQGPPGTGKTHTIANVICHYLAHGRKVLVTSMKEPALTVLRDHLPEEIKPLAISLLSSEQDGMKQFEHSISKIASEMQSLDRRAISREISALESSIDNAHSLLARVDRDITKWARRNLEMIRIDDEATAPETAAQEVVAALNEFEWFPDPLGGSPEYRPQFGMAEVVNLRAARRLLGKDIQYLGRKLPAADALPDAATLLHVHQDLIQSVVLKRELDSGGIPHLASQSDEHLALAQDLLASVESLKELRAEILSANKSWAAVVRQRLRAASDTAAFELLEALGDELEVALGERRTFLARPVSCPADIELDAELVEAVSNLSEGKRPFGMVGLIAKSDKKRTLAKVLVLGSGPASEADWRHVGAYLALQTKLRTLAVRWNALAPELHIDDVAGVQPHDALEAAASFSLYRRIRESVRIERSIEDKTKVAFPSWPKTANEITQSESFELLEKALRHHLTSRRLADVWVTRTRIQASIDGCEGPASDAIRRFLSATLGNPDVSVTQMQADWSNLIAELARLSALKPHLDTVADITSRISASGAKQWASALVEPLAGPVDFLLPDNWLQVWRWRRLATYLEHIDAHDELKTLTRQRAQTESLLRRAYEDMVTKRTWLKLTESATDRVRAELQAYLAAIKKIGKGTGKSAARYRQDARRAAAGAQPAVPCWIMPHYRVSESLPSELGSFDLVIVDEASQSDLTCLPALLRAKKVLIVGDDMQVSPEGVGLEEEKVRGLMRRFLGDQVDTFRPQMAPNRSMYDLFKVVFAKSTAMLKEHFRCVGPIIEYSKREIYQHELRPLRIPKASERLDPPLIDVLVEDGYRKGDLNDQEATFIVNEIAALVDDPKMVKRSIGVVSLLGDKQAMHIWQRLTEEIGPETMSRHRIACGDARTFQGKERDIMFLTMVCAPNNLGAAMTRATFAQRFNVAASRARDRMYLVRSVEIDQLSPADTLRRGLISHFSTPFAQDEARVEDQRQLCESPFEREVYDELTRRGFWVTPQVRVGRYRIDLVIEGGNDARLAVECDGDLYHGPDRWDDDMQRQRVLERAGWTFWRCFASAFVRRRAEVLEDLLKAIAQQGIEPVSGERMPRSRHSELRMVQANPIDEVSVGEGDAVASA